MAMRNTPKDVRNISDRRFGRKLKPAATTQNIINNHNGLDEPEIVQGALNNNEGK